MKKLLSLALLIVLANFAARATDLIVEEFGSTPTYGSITAAVAAAVDGDRIIIKNRAGAIPWVEDITITKTLDFLPYTNDSFFIVQGSYTIAATTQKTINIIGMVNTVGTIAATSTPTGGRTIVRILGCQLFSGNINIDKDNYDVSVVGNKLSSGVATLRHATVLGNDITGTTGALSIGTEGTITTDTLFIMDNKLTCTSNGSSGLYWNCSSAYFDIRNNFSTAGTYGINISSSKATNTTINKIYNNSVYTTYNSSTMYGIYVSTNTNTIVEVMNNICKRATGNVYTMYEVYASPGTSSQINCYYNVFDNSQYTTATSGTFTVNTNNSNTAVTFNANGVSAAATDLGNPSTIFYDLDLTRNDAGCYGGSFSMANFFPQFTGSARVYLTSYPFNIRTGNTLSVKGTSYDR